ncbi:NmrA family protein [Nitzschia inconspicua]|uniref:NmrA family protein n=1 Tax=Nitzschia inconspicua TaxID=303405 RepID=A0A9K3L245_9STRA|nr:NmrA family protein [Nitzschia inconspicua]
MGVSMSLTASKTMIVGGGGCIGIATLEHLLLRDNGKVDVRCGVRNVNKFRKNMIDVPAVPMDMADKEQMVEALRGCERVFIVVPSSKDRTKLAMNALEAAKEAKVQFILLLSVTISTSNTIFGRQFRPLEEKVMTMGIPYTIIRLPMFFENLLVHGQSVAEDDRIYDPRAPMEQFSGVAVSDVGKCAAEILRDPTRHANKTYKLVSKSFSMIDLSQSLSTMLHKKIKVKETIWRQFRQISIEQNVPEWQIEGTIEWLKYDPNVWITGDDQEAIKTITGDNPVTVSQFVAQHATTFGWKQPRIAPRDNDDERDDPIMQSRLIYAN